MQGHPAVVVLDGRQDPLAGAIKPGGGLAAPVEQAHEVEPGEQSTLAVGGLAAVGVGAVVVALFLDPHLHALAAVYAHHAHPAGAPALVVLVEVAEVIGDVGDELHRGLWGGRRYRS